MGEILSDIEPALRLSSKAERLGANTPVLPPVTASAGTRASSAGPANQTATSDGDSQSVTSQSGVSQSTHRPSL